MDISIGAFPICTVAAWRGLGEQDEDITIESVSQNGEAPLGFALRSMVCIDFGHMWQSTLKIYLQFRTYIQ